MLSLVFLVAAAGPENFAVDASKSVLKYHIVHKLHQVDAESHSVEARAVLQPDGTTQLMARSPVGSFKSGDGNRDEHMQEVVEANKFPNVTLKGTFKTEKPATFPAEQKVTLNGELEFHGVKQTVQVPVTLAWKSATRSPRDVDFQH